MYLFVAIENSWPSKVKVGEIILEQTVDRVARDTSEGDDTQLSQQSYCTSVPHHLDMDELQTFCFLHGGSSQSSTRKRNTIHQGFYLAFLSASR
ncbi:hypothetical protein JOB18_007839 [Solea senegalensis]|uniref:Uncharacterized protein n=1 Tax=Solea senegalensis TaxID=28829 RepID=A0AAV6SWM4_SOLSE|nr:hypothetical protein JOB18_007839 [Solea senegalensis]